MATGKILRFDEIRGYGFIAPDSGGEDVFLHANALLAEKHQYHPGVPVEFDVIEGERGLKATAVRVVKGREITPVPAAKPVPSPAVQAPATHGVAASPALPAVPPVPTPSSSAQPVPHPPAAQPHTSAANGASVATAAPPVTTPTTVTPASITPAAVTPATVAAASSHGSPAIAPQRSANGSERTVRDVLSPDALNSELVELCLESVPSMTGEQIGQLRRAVFSMARRHGWVTESA